MIDDIREGLVKQRPGLNFMHIRRLLPSSPDSMGLAAAQSAGRLVSGDAKASANKLVGCDQPFGFTADQPRSFEEVMGGKDE